MNDIIPNFIFYIGYIIGFVIGIIFFRIKKEDINNFSAFFTFLFLTIIGFPFVTAKIFIIIWDFLIPIAILISLLIITLIIVYFEEIKNFFKKERINDYKLFRKN